MTFQYPIFLWLLPLALLVWFAPRRGVGLRHGLLRTAVFAALLLGLARPVIISQSWLDHHVVVVDRSASIADAAAIDERLEQVRQRLPGGGVRVLVELDGQAASEVPGFERRIAVASDGSTSPLGLLLQHALRAIPDGASGAITLLSDGQATERGWARTLQELTARELPLHVVALSHDDANVRPVGCQALDDLRVGHVTRMRVAVAAASAQVQVTMHADGEQVAQSRPFRCEGVASVELPFEPGTAGYVDVRIEVTRTDAADSDPSDNVLQRTFAVQDPLRVLYLGARVRGAVEHLEQLLGDGFELWQPGGDGALDLARTDLTLLDDRPAAEVPDSWQRAIADAVQQRGMGLMLSGGRSAFGPGGYHNTVIETLSPVEFVQKEEKKDPSTTLAVVIDTSGSMVGNRMTLAKEVARLAIRRLQPHDKVGIVEFYGTKQWAAPIQSAANSIDLQRALNRLGASGGTVLLPAIEECFYALKNVRTRYKHVLLITDAGVETGAVRSRCCARWPTTASRRRPCSSVPGRHSEFLVELADWGGGRYYHSPDRFNLPELLLKKPSTSMLPPYRPGNVPQVETRGGARLVGRRRPACDSGRCSSLVETAPRDGADVLINGRSAAGDRCWRRGGYGLGRVSALSDGTGRPRHALPGGSGTATVRCWLGCMSRTARSAQPPFSFALAVAQARARARATCAARSRRKPTSCRRCASSTARR